MDGQASYLCVALIAKAGTVDIFIRFSAEFCTVILKLSQAAVTVLTVTPAFLELPVVLFVLFAHPNHLIQD